MKKSISLLILLITLTSLFGCTSDRSECQVVATTGPVYQFTQALCQGTKITVSQLITEEISCLHNYTLQVSQMRTVESADVVILSGAGLEDFMNDILSDVETAIDCSDGVNVMSYNEDHNHEHEHLNSHTHEHDPHIWLSPENATIMAQNICTGLSIKYPAYEDIFQANLVPLLAKLDALQTYGEETLSTLSCRELITFHDGFAYFAHCFGLELLEAVEEESGSEASAKDLKHLIGLVNVHQLPAIFTETNGSVSAAQVISRETGAAAFELDMAISSENYFTSMYRNIDTIKEALG